MLYEVITRFYLSDPHRGDAAVQAKLAGADPTREEVGILHASNQPTERGGFSLYVPEYYDGSTAMPLVVALHRITSYNVCYTKLLRHWRK